LLKSIDQETAES